MSRRAALAVVEGFYGTPWSHEARRDVLRHAARHGFAAYLWAPKADPLHRRRWDETPSSDHLDRTAELADEARALGMRWIYGLSPTVRVGVATDAARVVARLRPVQDVGVRSFVLGFDDTWPTLLPRLATRAAGRAHGLLAATVAAALRERQPDAEILVVPAIYAGRAEELPPGALDYLRGLAEHAGDLPSAWTGARIFSAWIRGDEIRALAAATGLSPWVWSNAIANDWLPLMTGEPLGRPATERFPGAWPDALAPDVITATSLVALNAAREPELTRAHLGCLASWARDPTAHDARGAFDRALTDAFGEEGAEVVRPLVEATARHALAAPARRDLAALDAAIADLVAARRTGGGQEEMAAVATRLAALVALPGRVSAVLQDRPLALEVGGLARKLAAHGRAGLAALDAIAAHDRADAAARRDALRRAATHHAVATRVRWDLDATAVSRLLAVARSESPRRPPRLLR